MALLMTSVTTVARAANTGFHSPSATSVVINQWSNPDRAYASEGNDAQEDLNGEQQAWHGFFVLGDVPAGAIIDGIQVDVEGCNQYELNGVDIELSWNGGTTFTNSLKGAIWPSSDQDSYETFGGPNDTWGRSWSSSDFADPDFQVRLTKKGSEDWYNFDVDHIRVIVYYTVASSCSATENWPVQAVRIDCFGAAQQGAGGCSDYAVDEYEDLDYLIPQAAETADIQAVQTGFDSEYFYIEYDFVADWNTSYSPGHQVVVEFDVDPTTESGRGDYYIGILQKSEFNTTSWVDAFLLGGYLAHVDSNNDVGAVDVAASDFGGSQGDGYESVLSQNSCDVLARVVNGNFQVAVRKSVLASPVGGFIRTTSMQSTSLGVDKLFVHDHFSAVTLPLIDNDGRLPIVTYWTPVGITYTLSGRVFADAVVGAAGQPYNGGEGDAGIANVRVELFDNAGTFQTFTTTDGSGNYSFSSLSANMSYTVRVVAAGVDAGVGALAEQTFESDGTTDFGGFGTAMGGQNAATVDTTTLATLTGAEHRVNVAVATANVTGVDFGFSFDVIVNTNNSGQGSLGQFINNANLIAGADTSIFNIPTTDTGYIDNPTDDWWRISPTGALPSVSGAGTIIDGTTQTTNQGDTNTQGPEIELEGSGAGASVNGINITGSNITIQDLVINQFLGDGIIISAGTGNLIAGNYIGTDAIGTADSGNGDDGIEIQSAGNTIGGTIAAARNIISGNTDDGILIDTGSATGNIVRGNYIGTDRNASTDLNNGANGISIKNGATGNTVGGTAAGAENVISGNGASGIVIRNTGSNNNTVQGNFIGTNATGTAVIGNIVSGVQITDGASGNTIGGTASDAGNTIAFNGADGVYLNNASSDDNLVSANAIYANGGIGIDIEPDGAGTGSGANNDKSAPVFGGITPSGSDFSVITTVTAGDTVEFFRVNNAAAPLVNPDGSGSGEGFLFLGSCVDNGACSGPYIDAVADANPAAGAVQALLLASGIVTGDTISATATDAVNGTSEFAVNLVVPVFVAISGTVFEDVNYGGGNGRSYLTANTSAVASGWTDGDIGIGIAAVELYNATGNILNRIPTAPDGSYSFNNLAPAFYTLRVVNSTVKSNRTSADGSEAAVQVYRADGDGEGPGTGATKVGGEQPGDVDAPANVGAVTLATLQAPAGQYTQSIVTVDTTGGDVASVDFGFNFDVIVNTNNAGQGSLRQFIANANVLSDEGLLDQDGLTTGAETSVFMIPSATDPLGRTADPNYNGSGNGEFTITPQAVMLPITAPVIIDATIQTTLIGNTNASGPEIELTGTALSGGENGLTLSSDNSTIKGLIINNFPGNGIQINGNTNLIKGNWIGIDVQGTNPAGNGVDGINIDGNGNTVGGAAAADLNVISDNPDEGVDVNGGMTGNIIIGNFIGTNAAGDAAIPNGTSGWSGGVLIDGDANRVGGATPGEGNLISGNNMYGIMLNGDSNELYSNRIGLNAAGTAGLPNTSHGILVRGTNATIGGTAVDQANTVAHNGGSGIHVAEVDSDNNRISANAIYSNTGLGIDLDPVGVGTGSGANNDKATPVVSSVSRNGADFVTITTVTAGDTIEFFRVNNPAAPLVTPDGTGYGEGYLFLGSCVDDGACSGPHISAVADADLTPGNVQATLFGSGIGIGDVVTATATDAGNNTSEFSANTTAYGIADLTLAKADSIDPAPQVGTLLYYLTVTNNGPDTATAVTLVDNLPPGTVFQTAIPSQGSCTGTGPVTCDLGGIVNGGSATVEIGVVTPAAGPLTNTAVVSSNESDLVPADNTASENTALTTTDFTDTPLTRYTRMHGYIDYTVTGGSLRTDDRCALVGSSTAAISGITAGATIRAAYLYWAGSGNTPDNKVQLDATTVTADRTFTGQYRLGQDFDFFSGFANVTALVQAKGNGNYTFTGLTVDASGRYCSSRAALSGWALVVVYEHASLTPKTLVLYDGLDIERNTATNYTLSGIYATAPPTGKTSFLVWEGDAGFTSSAEFFQFNGTDQIDALNPVQSIYNSTINSLGLIDQFGLDLDTFDVSALISTGDTTADTVLSVGPDMVILNAMVLQVRTDIITGYVFDDVNYGGGGGRDFSAAAADAGGFAVGRPNVVVELYDNAGNYMRSTTSDATGRYGCAGLGDGTYQVRVVNESVTSARTGSDNTEWPVQTFRTDGSGGSALPVTGEVGGVDPAREDDPANLTNANLSGIFAQTVAPVTISSAVTVANVDFGFNFDTIINTNNSGQGSLRRFILNSNLLGDEATMDQNGLTANNETSIFMIPSDSDPLGRPADSNFDAVGGVARITLTGALPVISDDTTNIDGTTQTLLIGDTNSGEYVHPFFGANKDVGTGPDAIESTGDEPQLPAYAFPEIEINGADQGIILEIAGSDITIKGLALYNADQVGQAGIWVSAGTGTHLEGNFVGLRADGTEPVAAERVEHGLRIEGGQADVLNNLVAYTNNTGILNGDASQIRGNEIYRVSLGNPNGDAISMESTSGQAITVAENRIDEPAGYGVETWTATGPFTIENNTVARAGQGGGVENGGMRLFGAGSLVRYNIIAGSAGAGITVVQRNAPGSNQQNRISMNSLYNNGVVGIDLDVTNTGTVNPNGDGVTPNDGLTNGSLPNLAMDYPVFTVTSLNGSTLHVEGYVGTSGTPIAGIHTIEVFKADDDGNNNGEVESGDAQSVAHGEGRWYIDSCNSAADGTFNCNLTVPAAATLVSGDSITATAADVSDNTSEFSANYPVYDFAVTSALAEITANDVPIFSLANSFTYDIAFTINGTDTGVDQVTVSVPATFGDPTIIDVLVGGASVGYTDNTSGKLISVLLGTKVTVSETIEIVFTSDGPAATDAIGKDFTSTVDDSGTGIPAQNTTQGNGDGDAGDANDWTVTCSNGNLALVKKAFFSDGTPIADGATLPSGVPVFFMIYINNRDAARGDVSLRDILDPSFVYQNNSMKVANAIAECATNTCTAIEEGNIFSAVDAASVVTDGVDGDIASITGATIDVGDASVVGNGQLDINANSMWALLFTVVMN